VTIEEIDRKVAFLLKLRRVLDRDPESMTELILQKYVQMGKTQDVAQWLNDCGYRISGVRGSRKYISTDITEIIDTAENVDEQLIQVVRGMQRAGRLLERHLE